MEELVEYFKLEGITDPRIQANIIAQVQRESGGKPKSENLNYSAKRLMEVFPKYFKDLDDAEKVVAQGPEAIGNRVYGGRMGNKADEGYKYHGRGLIQLTGKNNYKQYGELLGIDLVNNPELANDPVIAQKIATSYYLNKGKGKDLSDINVVNKLTGFVDKGGEGQKRIELADKIFEDIRPQDVKAPGVNPFEAQLQTAENAALISNFGAPKPKEVITDTETITEKGPGFIDRFTSGIKELYPFNEGGPVEEQITTESINVTPSDNYYRNYMMQEAARRSMMQGNEEERMYDYDYARDYAEDYPYLYPRRARSVTRPPMQAAQRMMGGFAQGGVVDQAQGLASLGRGGDSTLVHMQPREVAGLQQLAQANGTSLTRNPMTGYPEAFSLGGMFKAALPIAAGYFAGPAGFAGMSAGTGSAITAGALTGAGVAAASGDDVLAGGLSGGLGGYSGMGLESALMGTGAAVPTAGVDSTINPALVSSSAPITSTASAGSIGSFNPALDSTLTTAGGGGASLTPGNAFDPNINRGAGFLDRVATNLQVPELTGTSLYDSSGGQMMRATGGVTPAGPMKVAMKLGSPIASMGLGGLEESDFMVKPDFNDPRDKYDPRSKLNLSRDTGINEAMSRDTGLRLLAKGGYLKGPGDGMSDDIPATINGDEPAALADGEFVVPADVVSHLGNGSSEAGSKQLYAMMDRIRKARTGRESQGKEIEPGKYMPR